jgi:hypothetical protein
VAVIVRERGLLFIMVPHTGCTAVGNALIQRLGGAWLPKHSLRNAEGKITLGKKHNTLPQLLQFGLLTPEERLPLLVAGTVRNPFDWLVSQYLRFLPLEAGDRSGLVTTPSGYTQGDPRYQGEAAGFEAWLVHRYAPRRRRGPLGRLLPARARRQVDWLAGVDAVLRFEQLQETFDALLARVGVEQPIPLPVVNETVSRAGRDYREWYTPRAREVAEEVFAAYLARHRYSFEESHG